MAKNGDTRKLLLDIDIETMEYINDYKYAMLLSQGIVMTNVDIFIAAIQSLKRETEKEGKLNREGAGEFVRSFGRYNVNAFPYCGLRFPLCQSDRRYVFFGADSG